MSFSESESAEQHKEVPLRVEFIEAIGSVFNNMCSAIRKSAVILIPALALGAVWMEHHHRSSFSLPEYAVQQQEKKTILPANASAYSSIKADNQK